MSETALKPGYAKQKGSLSSWSLHSGEVESLSWDRPGSACLLPRCHHGHHQLLLILSTGTSIMYLTFCQKHYTQCLKLTCEIRDLHCLFL